MSAAQRLWTNALPLLEQELPTPIFNTMVAELEAHDVKGSALQLVVGAPTTQDFLRQRYAQEIEDYVSQANGGSYSVEFLLKSEVREALRAANTAGTGAILNPRYTFDTFVIGRSNHFAHAAAQAVANNPGHSYNPLYIYGGVGLGKTHLMHAVGNQIRAAKPRAKIIYVTAENFTNEVISYIRSDRSEQFRAKYRNVDVLMVDDIQFIAGKDSTQTEFFNTFNDLYERQKQIIITSDKLPKEIGGLEDRLVSRFEWGLQVDVQRPDYETRVAILQRKAEFESLYVPMEVLNFIAENVKSNIRELEGTLTRIMAYAMLMDREIDLDLAKEALPGIGGVERRPLTLEVIRDAVADYFQLSQGELSGKKRSRNVALPRQIAMYLSRELTDEPLQRIGQVYEKDHSTVMHGVDKIASLVDTDERLKGMIDDIVAKLDKR